MELKLFLRNWSRYKLLKNNDCTKVRLEAAIARMNKNPFLEDPNHVRSSVLGPDLSFWKKENVCRTSPPSDVGSLPPGQWQADREPEGSKVSGNLSRMIGNVSGMKYSDTVLKDITGGNEYN